jgi:invasion protein IalB
MYKHTLVLILLCAVPALADPPAAHAPPLRAFDDWRLDCRQEPCAIATSVAGADGSEVLRLASTGGALAVTTALPLHLPDGIVLAFGDRLVRPAPWRTCSASGCEATLPLDPELGQALRRERDGSATFTLVDGVAVRLPFSLIGYSAALRAAAEVSPAP